MLRYYPEKSIGQGVFGTCYKAYFQGTVVCVKELKNNTESSKSAILHEAEILNRLGHINLKLQP